MNFQSTWTSRDLIIYVLPSRLSEDYLCCNCHTGHIGEIREQNIEAKLAKFRVHPMNSQIKLSSQR